MPVSPESMASEIVNFEQAVTTSVAEAGTDSPAALAARSRLGRAYAFAGRFDAALGLLTENVAASERALGADHPDAIVARNDLARAWRVAGYLPEAMTAQENCVADLDRVLGPGSAQAARARIDHARLLTLTGARDLARQHLEQGLADLSATVGPDHPDTLCCQMELASAYRAEGETGDAVAAAERTAASCERLLEPDDPEAISCRATLGAIYTGAARREEAIALLEGALADFRRVLGPEHVQSIRTGTVLANALRAAGQTGRAIAEAEQTVTTAGRVLVPQHRLTTAARLSLAMAYRHAGRAADAVPVMDLVIRDYQPASPVNVAQLRGFRFLLANYLVLAGRTADGITLAEDLVAEGEEAGEPAGEMTVNGRLLLAELYTSALRHGEAAKVYRAVLPDVRHVFGPDHQKSREVERRLWNARRLRAYPVTRHPVLGTALAVVTLAGFLAFAFWPRSPALAPPPKPGYESPASAVAGYTAGLFTRHPAVACRYTAPSERGICTGMISVFAPLTEMTGRWTIGHTAISGNRAIVDVEYHATGYNGGVSMDNTDPNAGLPNAGLSFDAAYRDVFSSQYAGYATDCVLVGGRWYVDDVQSGS
jgi:tetratricopeptide (TPR) repeat protein